MPLKQKLRSNLHGYKYDKATEITDPYKYRCTINFSNNRICSLRHELNRQTLSFQNYCLQFLMGVMAYDSLPTEEANLG